MACMWSVRACSFPWKRTKRLSTFWQSSQHRSKSGESHQRSVVEWFYNLDGKELKGNHEAQEHL